MNSPRNTPEQIGEVARADTPSSDSVTSKAAHTPGPWRHGGSSARRPWADTITTVADVSIAQVYGIPSNWTVPEADKLDDERCRVGLANARLIAAAPDLLAACGEAERLIELLHRDHPHPTLVQIGSLLHRAIRKAQS